MFWSCMEMERRGALAWTVRRNCRCRRRSRCPPGSEAITEVQTQQWTATHPFSVIDQ